MVLSAPMQRNCQDYPTEVIGESVGSIFGDEICIREDVYESLVACFQRVEDVLRFCEWFSSYEADGEKVLLAKGKQPLVQRCFHASGVSQVEKTVPAAKQTIKGAIAIALSGHLDQESAMIASK